MDINAKGIGYTQINELIRAAGKDINLLGCMGQRFIAAGMSEKNIKITGVPGNALGAYLDGATLTVNGNAQDAIGDTMNDGKIIVHGNAGDAVGYAMRGGEIYVKGNVGYRAGIHMKAYKEKKPVIVIGGKAGSFLGEYQAGGIIIVLGLGINDKPIASNFSCTGMHGGRVFLRSDCANILFPSQVTTHAATAEEIDSISDYIINFAKYFSCNAKELLDAHFTVITPDSHNPYVQNYVTN